MTESQGNEIVAALFFIVSIMLYRDEKKSLAGFCCGYGVGSFIISFLG